MAKTKKTTKKTRKTVRRKTQDRRGNNPVDVFWTKVINGVKKFLSPPFKGDK